MAITVRNIRNNKFYILLSASFSFFKDSRPGIFGGNLLPQIEEGEFKIAAVCNKNGEIEWFPSADLKVLEIDGVSVASCLDGVPEKYGENRTLNSCPACGHTIYEDDRLCSSCGITLIVDEENIPKF
jgi:predicted RNA-binding Zn-ribbon protein involved in translation (DUF1610 family)